MNVEVHHWTLFTLPVVYHLARLRGGRSDNDVLGVFQMAPYSYIACVLRHGACHNLPIAHFIAASRV